MVIKRLYYILIALFISLFTILTPFVRGKALATQSNLIPNASVETPDPSNSNLPEDWSGGYWGSNSPIFSYLDSGYNSNHSVEVQVSNYISGDAKWYFDPVGIQAGSKYIFSDYYKSDVSNDVVAQFTNSDGSYSYQDLGSAVPTSVWKKYQATFSAPSTAIQVTIFHLINSNGSLTTDDFSLNVDDVPTVSVTSPSSKTLVSGDATLTANASAIDGIASVQFSVDGSLIGKPLTSLPYQYNWDSSAVTNGTHILTATAIGNDGESTTSNPITISVSNTDPPGGNLIPNPLINTSASQNSNPQDWSTSGWGTNTAVYSYLDSGYYDSHSLQIQMTSYSSGDAKWYFTPQLVSSDTQYTYSEFYSSTIQTQVVAVFRLTNGQTLYQIIGEPDVASSWSMFTTKFSIPLGTANLTIYHLIQGVGTLTTDDFSLTPYTPTGFSRPLVSLTFDDGYSSTYQNALPLLKQYGFESTQFIITSLIGTKGYMTKNQVKALYLNGQEIASHTVTHPNLTLLSNLDLNNELSNSQSALQSWLQAPITGIAYPFGLYNTNVLNATQQYYGYARGVEDGLNSKDNFNPYDIKVQNIFDTTSTAQVEDWVHQAQVTNTWLVLVYHSVNPNQNPFGGKLYNVTPTQLNSELNVIQSSGVTIETMQKAFNEVSGQL